MIINFFLNVPQKCPLILGTNKHTNGEVKENLCAVDITINSAGNFLSSSDLERSK